MLYIYNLQEPGKVQLAVLKESTQAWLTEKKVKVSLSGYSTNCHKISKISRISIRFLTCKVLTKGLIAPKLYEFIYLEVEC